MTYAPIVITAVDHTTGIFTSVGHNLVTGGGFVGNPNGPSWGGDLFAPAGGVIPTGLAGVTAYWPIRIDADHFKLASSNALAMSGTAVTFSTNGTLPLSFLVGLPYEVPRTSAPLTMIFSDDDNTTWQALKALWALLTGQAETVWNGNIRVAGQLAGLGDNLGHSDTTDTILGADFAVASGTVSYVDGRILTTSAATIVARLPLKTGDRIKSVTSLVGGDGSVDMTSFTVLSITAGVGTSIGSTSASNLTSTDVTVDVTDTKLAAGQAILVKVVANAALFALDNVRYTYDRPVT